MDAPDPHVRRSLSKIVLRPQLRAGGLAIVGAVPRSQFGGAARLIPRPDPSSRLVLISRSCVGLIGPAVAGAVGCAGELRKRFHGLGKLPDELGSSSLVSVLAAGRDGCSQVIHKLRGVPAAKDPPSLRGRA